MVACWAGKMVDGLAKRRVELRALRKVEKTEVPKVDLMA